MLIHRTIRGFVALLPMFLLPVRAIAAGESSSPPEAPKGILPIPDYTGDFWHATHLAGDFNGERTKLAEKGIQVDVEWTQIVQNIVNGGRDETTRYGGTADYLIHLDLMRMGILPGGLITFRAESRYGASVNGAAG